MLVVATFDLLGADWPTSVVLAFSPPDSENAKADTACTQDGGGAETGPS